MAKTLVFEVKINGIRSAVTGTDDLKEAIKATRKELGQTDFGSKKYQDLQKQLGGLKKVQKDVNADTREAGRQFEISADKGKQSYRALNAELVSLRNSFKDLSRAEREGATGDAFRKKIQALDTELKEIDGSIGNYQRNVGNYQSVLEGLGGVNIAELATVPGAILAVGTAAIKAGQFVLELTERFRKLRGEVSNFVGGSTEEIDEFTARVAGISDTFEASTEEILNAANTVSRRLGIPFQEALDGIEEGFIAGSNQNGEFLDSLREYPAFFAEAGLGADQLFKVLNQQATEGIYSDKGVDTIKEATLRLRELPTATVSALESIGLSSEQIRKTIAEDGIGAAIAQVSKQLGTLEKDSPEIGQAIADIFGGPGEDAGVDFLLSLQNLNEETGSLIDSSNEYQAQQQRTLEVNQEFAEVQNEVAKQLGGTSASFGDLGTIIQTKALQALVFIIDRFKTFFEITLPIRQAIGRLAEAFGLVNEKGEATKVVFDAINVVLKAQEFVWKLTAQAIGFAIDQITAIVNKGREFLEFIGVLDSEAEQAEAAAEARAKAAAEESEQEKKNAKAKRDTKKAEEETADAIRETNKQINDRTKALQQSVVATEEFAAGSSKALKEEVSRLKKELDSIAPEDQRGVLQELLKAEEALKDVEQYRKDLREALTRDAATALPQLETIGPGQVQSIEREGPSQDERIAQIERQKLARIEAAREVADTEEQFARERQLIELEANRAILRERKKGLEENSIELLQVEQSIADTTTDINRVKVEILLEQERRRAQQLQEIQQAIFGSISESINALTQASQSRAETETNALERRYQREIDLAEDNEQRQEELRTELAEKTEQIRQREFEKQKKYRVAAALTSLAEGVVNILSAPTTIPDPFGAIFKAIRVGVLTATTAQQVNAINRQQAARGILAESAPVKTGMRGMVGQAIRGATHNDPSGGVEIAANGRNILAEAGEFVDVDEYGGVAIINKRSTAALRRDLQRNAGRTFPGKRQFLSGVNNYKNYGITFARQGALARPNVEAAISSPSGQGVTTVQAEAQFTDEQTATIAERIAERTGKEVKEAMSKGLLDTNRRIEREQRLSGRTGRT